MYEIKIVEKYYLIDKEQNRYEYSSYQELIELIPYNILERCGKEFKDRVENITYVSDGNIARYPFIFFVDYIIRTECGDVVDPEEVRADKHEYNKIKYAKRRRYRPKHVKFRYDPIPCISSHRYGRFYRRIKTTQERRMSFTEKEDGVKFRSKRNARNLSNSWDDIPRRLNKNWKKYRKTQYK